METKEVLTMVVSSVERSMLRQRLRFGYDMISKHKLID
jgi:hypothetical protein